MMKSTSNDACAKISISDVAKAAGVSSGTASRALNSVGYVKEETKQKVLNAAKQLNYIPDRSGRVLKTRETRQVILAIPDSSNEIYFGMIEAVQNELRKKGYLFLLFFTCGELENELEAVRMLQEHMADGLILVHFSYAPALEARIRECTQPVVLISMCTHKWAGQAQFSRDTISVDVYKGIYSATSHLIKQGHTRIGYLAGQHGLTVYEQRYQAYRDAMRDAGIEPDEELVKWNDYSIQGGYSSGRSLYLMDDRPTAICASNDLQAIGCYQAVKDLNGTVPGTLALTGMDNLLIMKLLNLTSIDMKEAEMGEAASKLLLRRMAGEDFARQDVFLTPELRIRESSLYSHERNI